MESQACRRPRRRATQYPGDAAEYWIPAFAGMTPGELVNAGPVPFHRNALLACATWKSVRLDAEISIDNTAPAEGVQPEQATKGRSI